MGKNLKLVLERGLTALCGGIREARETAESAGSAASSLAQALSNGLKEVEDALKTKADTGHTHTKSQITDFPTSQDIDGVAFDGSTAITHYGTCATAAGTTAKTAALDGFTLSTGARVAVKFTNANTAASPTLNVNGTGAKAIVKYGTTKSMAYMWTAGELVEFVYDGTNWVMENGGIATTTYYGRAKLSSAVDSTSTALAATPSAVK